MHENKQIVSIFRKIFLGALPPNPAPDPRGADPSPQSWTPPAAYGPRPVTSNPGLPHLTFTSPSYHLVFVLETKFPHKVSNTTFTRNHDHSHFIFDLPTFLNFSDDNHFLHFLNVRCVLLAHRNDSSLLYPQLACIWGEMQNPKPWHLFYGLPISPPSHPALSALSQSHPSSSPDLSPTHQVCR